MSRKVALGLVGMALASVAGCGGAKVSSSRAAATIDSLVGNWLFVEGDGQTATDVVGGNTGQLGSLPTPESNDPVWLTEPGLAFQPFEYVRVPNASALEPTQVSVEAWVRGSSSPGSWLYVVSKGGQDCSASSYALATASGGGLGFYVLAGGAPRFSPEATPAAVWDGQWHQAIGTYDGTTSHLYLDGAEVGTPTAGDAAPIQYGLDVSNDLYFGTYGGSCDLPFTGSIRGVRIYRAPLGADDVKARFAAPYLPPVDAIPTCPIGQDCGKPQPPPPPPPGTVATFIPVQVFRDEWHKFLQGSELRLSTSQDAPAPGEYKACTLVPAPAAQIDACKQSCATLGASPEQQRCKAQCNQLTTCSYACSSDRIKSFFAPGSTIGIDASFTCKDPSDTCPVCVPGQLTNGGQVQPITNFQIPPFWVLDTEWTCQLSNLDFNISDGFDVRFTTQGLVLSLVGTAGVPAVTCDSSYDFDINHPTITISLTPSVSNRDITVAVGAGIDADVSVDGRADPVASSMGHDALIGQAGKSVNGFLDSHVGSGSIRGFLGQFMAHVIKDNLPQVIKGGVSVLANVPAQIVWSSDGMTVYSNPCACNGNKCGDDGCGGSCGTCAAGTTCSAGQCVCVPSCPANWCGPNGCGGSCGCPGDTDRCINNACCTPSCGKRQCGSNGCGGSCGECAPGQTCSSTGICKCTPKCDGKSCGDDGCGGVCGTCGAGSTCCAGVCKSGAGACCGGVWTNLSNDDSNCGGCGNVCSGNSCRCRLVNRQYVCQGKISTCQAGVCRSSSCN
jgi:hypothetical protein